MMTALRHRVLFIDMLRGFCILVVVMQHVGWKVKVPGLFALDTAVACFYFLSGYFFERSAASSSSTGAFLKKKVKSLLLPFVIWYIVGYLMFYSIRLAMPALSLGSVEYHGVEDLFIQRHLFNGPIWFVLSLFYVELSFWLLRKISFEQVRVLLVIALSGGGICCISMTCKSTHQ